MHKGLQILKMLKKYKFYHRDIKTSNFVFSKDLQNLKLIDFGSSNNLKGEMYKEHRVFGTSFFAAPEIDWYLIRNLRVKTHYNFFHADLYSFGITILHILFPLADPEQLCSFADQIYWKKLYPTLLERINILLDPIPNKREKIFKKVKLDKVCSLSEFYDHLKEMSMFHLDKDKKTKTKKKLSPRCFPAWNGF